MKYNTIILTLTFVIMLIACEKIITPTESKFSTFSQQISEYTGNYYTESELRDMYDNNNLAGVIIFRKEYRNDYVAGGTVTNPQYLSFDGYENDCAGVFFTTNPYTNYSLKTFVVNAMQMREYQTGYYTPYKEIDIYMGSTLNKYVIESNNVIPGFIDSVSFSDEIRITSFSKDDTLDVADTTGENGYPLTWSDGFSNGKVQIEFKKIDCQQDSITQNTYTGLSFIIDNSHQYFLYNRMFANLQLQGLYNITVTSYEPIIRTMPNNKQILLVGMSQHTVSVYFKR